MKFKVTSPVTEKRLVQTTITVSVEADTYEQAIEQFEKELKLGIYAPEIAEAKIESTIPIEHSQGIAQYGKMPIAVAKKYQ